jgi:hypothetical protein
MQRIVLRNWRESESLGTTSSIPQFLKAIDCGRMYFTGKRIHAVRFEREGRLQLSLSINERGMLPVPALTTNWRWDTRRLMVALWLLCWAPLHARASDAFGSAYISEILVESTGGSEGGGKKQPGWIEIYNGGSYTANLAGWFLTDSPSNLTKWRFPEVGLLPGNYLVVSASGTGQTDDLAHLQTNFKLNKNGGYLALVNASTNIVSEFAPSYPKQSEDISYGRLLGEPQLCGHFVHPTPGKANQSSGPGFAPRAIFSRGSGTFTKPFTLELTGGSSTATIRYTLNGKLPTRTSAVYREPLAITNTTYVRARVFQDDLLPGPPQSGSYQLLSASAAQFASRLPVLIMDTSAANQSVSTRSSLVQLSFYEPKDGTTSVTNPPTLTTRGGFHIRGSTSAQMDQPGFALQFVDGYNHEQHEPVLGMPANSDWVLYAPTSYDPVMIHNPFVHQLSRDMGRYSPRTRFLEVYFVRHAGPISPRDYFGLYVLEEKIKVGKHRVAIDRLGPDDLNPPEVTGGYLLKFDRLGPGESGLWAGGTAMVYVEPKEPVITLPQRAPQQAYITSYFEEFNQVLRSPQWKDPERGYRAYIDVESWIDFHVLEVLSGNVDALKFSTFFYKPRGGKITFGPHWDFDRALGSPDYRDNFPNRWNTGRFFDAPWWGRLFRDPDFWQLWVDRWQELRRTLFSEANLSSLVDRLADEVREAQPREAKRWQLDPRGGTYQSEVDWMKNWLSQRTQFIDGQLTAPPQLSQPSGAVKPGSLLTLTGPSGATLYYTLDGSDPRLAQGGISAAAVEYSEPIALKADTRIVARARDPNQHQTGGPHISTPWSSPVKGTYQIRP